MQLFLNREQFEQYITWTGRERERERDCRNKLRFGARPRNFQITQFKHNMKNKERRSDWIIMVIIMIKLQLVFPFFLSCSLSTNLFFASPALLTLPLQLFVN